MYFLSILIMLCAYSKFSVPSHFLLKKIQTLRLIGKVPLLHFLTHFSFETLPFITNSLNFHQHMHTHTHFLPSSHIYLTHKTQAPVSPWNKQPSLNKLSLNIPNIFSLPPLWYLLCNIKIGNFIVLLPNCTARSVITELFLNHLSSSQYRARDVVDSQLHTFESALEFTQQIRTRSMLSI